MDPGPRKRALEGQVAIVTGASRGVGKGVPIALGEAGATVYVTGRTVKPGRLPGTIDETAAEVTRRGGRGVACVCDHAKDADVGALFARVLAERGRVDVLVNNAFAIPDGRLTAPFWELPLSHWDTMHGVGLRSHYVAAVLAAPCMLAARRGLIVNVSSFGAKVYAVNVAYGVGKAGVDRMTRDMARELEPHGVAVVSLWPGVVRTERLAMEPERFGFDATVSESPVLTGRAVVALASDPARMEQSGKALVVAELAREYGFSDIDGAQPASLRDVASRPAHRAGGEKRRKT